VQAGWPSQGLCLELGGPDAPQAVAADASLLTSAPGEMAWPDANDAADAVLAAVYGAGAGRAILLCSASPQLALTLHWKQPNFPVIFRTYAGRRLPAGGGAAAADPRTASLQRAVRFAKATGLLGILCEAAPLRAGAALVHAVKKEGLILAAFAEDDDQGPAALARLDALGVDAIVAHGRLRVKNAQSWL
jgi:CDK inhibitor PHO81